MAQFGDSHTFGTRREPANSYLARHGERRAECRQSMNLPGVCESLDPPQQFACTIVDMSGSGAQLAFASTDPIPATFKVHVAALNVIMDCRVVWRAQKLIGVEQTVRSAGYE